MKQWHAFHFKIDSFRALIIAGCANYNVCEIIIASRCGHLARRMLDHVAHRLLRRMKKVENGCCGAMNNLLLFRVVIYHICVFNKIITIIITFFEYHNGTICIFAIILCLLWDCLVSYDPVVRIRNVAMRGLFLISEVNIGKKRTIG